MNILVYEPDADLRTVITNTLILNGFYPKVVQDPRDLIPELQRGIFRLMVSSVPEEQDSMLQLLRQLRSKPEFRFLQVALYLEKAEQRFVMDLIASGFTMFMVKPFLATPFMEKLNGFVQNIPGIPDKRQHVRITLAEYENARIVLTTAQGRKITAHLVNISAGGVNVEFSGERMFQRINVNDVMAHALIVMKHLDLFVDLKVMNVRESGFGAKFINLDDAQLRALCQFLHERILRDNLHANPPS